MNHPPRREILDRIPLPGELILGAAWVTVAVTIAAMAYALVVHQ